MRKITFYLLAFVLFGCSKNDDVKSKIELSKSEISITRNEKITVPAISDLKLTYKSDNDFVATVSDSGVVKGGCQGVTKITVSNEIESAVITITNNSLNHLYPDPLLSFGESKNSVTAKLGTPGYQTTTGAVYYNSPTTTGGTTYLFENDKLTGVGVLVKVAYVDQLSSYLLDRFSYVGRVDDYFVFSNELDLKKVTISVALTVYSTSYYMVIYSPYSSSSSVKSLMPKFNSLKESANKLK